MESKPVGRVVPLAGPVLDRVGERRTDADWLAARWADPRTRVLHVLGGEVESAGDPPALVLVAPYATDADAVRLLLGVDDDDVAYFGIVGRRPGAEADGEAATGWRTLRDLGSGLSLRDADLAVHALGLANWHEAHTHCPRCGAPTTSAEAGHVRVCTADESVHHPRTDPAVIMLVVDETDRALLGRHARWPGARFSTLAGFVEPGESAEAAVAREVLEESGVVVDDVTFVASQPWPFPSSLMLGFTARARASEPVPDGLEMAEVRWFTREELLAEHEAGTVQLPPRLSVSRRLIEDWYGGSIGSDTAW